MTTFKYKAVSPNGAKVEGIINAYDEVEAVSKLRETCSIITKIEEVKTKDENRTKPPKIKEKDLSILCSQFSIILAAGLPIVTCIKMVANQQKKEEVKKMLQKVADDIDAGYSMASSFEKNNPSLPKTFIETLRAGEQSGTLESCFKRLQTYYDKTSKTKSKLISSLMYPALVIFVAIVVVIIIMVVAVPAFTSAFVDLGVELPGLTKGLIAVSNFFVGYWWLIILAGAGIGLAYFLASRSEGGKKFLAEFSLTKSPLSKLNSMNAASTFATTMATMISAGLPIIECLKVTSNVVTNYVFSLEIDRVRQKVEQGSNMGDSMKEIKYFPTMLSEMTSVGESSGTLESTLNVIGDYFANEVDVTTSRLISLLEPCITVFLALITVVLLLAVYLPMFSMYGSI